MRSTKYLIGLAFLFLSVMLLQVGCTRYKPKEESKEAAHDHPDKGPHGGWLAELSDNEEYHAELLPLDKEKKQATVYILDGTAKKTAAIDVAEITLNLKAGKSPVQVKLAAAPEKGEKGGTSRFIGTHEKFADDLDPDEIEVSFELKGKPFEGTFIHEHKK